MLKIELSMGTIEYVDTGSARPAPAYDGCRTYWQVPTVRSVWRGWIITVPVKRWPSVSTDHTRRRVLGVRTVESASGRMLRWIHGFRYRQSSALDHSRLHWYRHVTTTYRLTAHCILPTGLRPLAHVTVTGLENVPPTGPVILAANHCDNLDAFLLLHVVPRYVHVAARPDGFGTGSLCALWRRLGAFPADAWGIRYGLRLLADGDVVAVFPQGRITKEFVPCSGAASVLVLRSGAPVVPVAIQGTEAVHLRSMLTGRANVHV